MKSSWLISVERWLWYIFCATAAWQTRIILWQADPMFIEWRSATLYATDILMAALFILAAVRSRGWFVRRMDRFDWLLGFVAAAAVLSLSHTDQLIVGLVQMGRLLQYILLYLYLRHWAFRKFDADGTALAFVIGALAQAGLAVTQYALQHDIGLRLIGESVVRTDMRGVAVFYDLAHVKILRAYGTFPHPNVLAAYLIVALWIERWLFLRHGGSRPRWVWIATTALMLVALYTTWSRTMIAAWLMSSAVVVIAAWWPRLSGSWPNVAVIRTRLYSAVVVLAVVTLCFFALQWHRAVARMTVSGADEAVRLRVMYAQDAVATGGGGLHLHINWTGVGIGNFTTWLARFDPSMPQFLYQPAHNYFLLLYSEIGLTGLTIYAAWMLLVFRACWRGYRGQPFIRLSLVAMMGAVVFMALFDHFFWTLQQGRILWWSVLALAAGASRG